MDIDAGSISALLRVKYLYRIDVSKKDKTSMNSLTVIDVQYLGQQDVNSMIERLVSPQKNSIYVTKNHNLLNTINATNGTSKMKGGSVDLVPFITTDELYAYLDEPVYCGSVTKLSRKPVISVYTIPSLEVIKTTVGGANAKSVGSDNKNNYMITDRNGSNFLLVADPVASKIKHIASYRIDKKGAKSEYMLKKMDNLKNDLENYKADSMDDILKPEVMVGMIDSLLK